MALNDSVIVHAAIDFVRSKCDCHGEWTALLLSLADSNN